MKLNFKKIGAVTAGLLMSSMTLGLASAASFPAPFVENGAANVAIVYGSNLDMGASTSITSALASSITSDTKFVSGDVKLTDDEVTLGGSILGGDINTPIQDNKLSTLKDDKFSWDDGSGSDDYDFHEEVVVGTMEVKTTLDDKTLEGVALTNEKALEYRYVLEDALNVTAIGTDDADTLYLEIMGKEYEVESATSTSITVTTSEQTSLAIGDTYTTPEGKVVTLVDVFDGSVEVSVDGSTEVINTDNTKKISGVRVNVESVGYHSNSPETSKAILKIGADISKTYTNGDEYIGEDEDDPLWVWTISSFGSANGYVGVKYNAKIDSANDEIAGDSIKYVGDAYVLPGNYAAVTLDGLTSVNYEDLKIYFEDSEDLFNNSDGSTALVENQPVLVIEAEDTDRITVNSIDTDKVYLWYNATSGIFQSFYHDFDGDYTPTGYMRLADDSVMTVTAVTGAQTEFATIEIGDTNLDADIEVIAGVAYLTITNDDFGNNEVVYMKVSDSDTLLNATAGTGALEQLGATEEDAEAGDIVFNGTDVSTEDYSYTDHYGIKLSDGTDVNAEADDDKATLSIPDEQVYASITVSMGGSVEEGTSSLGDVIVKDTEVDSVKTKNLIIVGGSCINSAAAKVLGGAYCGEAFTTATGVKAGEFLIKGVQDAYTTGKLALVVAGYEAADTVNAATYLTKKDVDTSKSYKGTTATNAELVTA